MSEFGELIEGAVVPEGYVILSDGEYETIVQERKLLLRVVRAAEKWQDCAVYDEDANTWTVFEKDDEYHKLFEALEALPEHLRGE